MFILFSPQTVFQESSNGFYVRLLPDVIISDVVQLGLPYCPSQHPHFRRVQFVLIFLFQVFRYCLYIKRYCYPSVRNVASIAVFCSKGYTVCRIHKVKPLAFLSKVSLACCTSGLKATWPTGKTTLRFVGWNWKCRNWRLSTSQGTIFWCRLHIGALKSKKIKKNPSLLWKWVGGWWVQVSLGFFLENRKSSQNSPKPALIFWSSIPCVFCLYIHC